MTRPTGEELMRLRVEAARMYYEQDLSQGEIADRLARSRATVSRLLADARSAGIVHIDIRVPGQRFPTLEDALVERFGLREARVVAGATTAALTADNLGRAAAPFLQSILEGGMRVGMSNGRALAATAKFLQPRDLSNLSVIQIIGSLAGDDPAIDGPDIVRELARAYGAQYRYLHVPLLVPTREVKLALSGDNQIAQTLALGAQADLAVVGVGTVDSSDPSPIFAGLLSDDEIATVRAARGVGSICGEHYGIDGHRLDIDVNDRVMSIGLAALKRIRRVIAVAGGRSKVRAILGGIRGGYFDTLVTDDSAAEALLDDSLAG